MIFSSSSVSLQIEMWNKSKQNWEKKKKFMCLCQRLEKVSCFNTSCVLGVCGRGWVRHCWGEIVPCPHYSPALQCWSVMAHCRQPQFCLTHPLSGQKTRSPSGRKAQCGPKRFKNDLHQSSTLSFNPAFILELYTAETQELVAMSVLLSLFCLILCWDKWCYVVFTPLHYYLIFYSFPVNFNVLSQFGKIWLEFFPLCPPREKESLVYS